MKMGHDTTNSLSKEHTRAEIDEYLTGTGGQDKTERLKLIDIARALNMTTDDVRDLVRKRKIGHYRCGKETTNSQLQLVEYRLSLPQEVEVKAILAAQEKPLADGADNIGSGPPFALAVNL